MKGKKNLSLSQQDKITEQQTAIEERNKEITLQRENLDVLLADVNKKQSLLKAKEEQIGQKDLELQNQLKSLEKGKLAIEEQDAKILEQKTTLALQSTQISFQQNLIVVAIVFVLLVLGLAYFIYRSLKIQKRSKKEIGGCTFSIVKK